LQRRERKKRTTYAERLMGGTKEKITTKTMAEKERTDLHGQGQGF
jgi:hypothetical protein